MLDVTANAKITQINASVDRGGWECQFEVYNDTDLFDFGSNFQALWEGGFGGAPGTPRLGFNGYVVPSRFEFNPSGSVTTHVAQTSDGFLRRAWLQGIGFADQDTTARAHYHQFDSVTGTTPERMTMGRLVRHILGYYDELDAPPATNPDWVAHTNMVYHETQNPHGWISLDGVEMEPFNAISRPQGSMRVDKYIVRETDNLWSRLSEIATNEFFYIYFDKFDKLWYQRHPMYATVLPTPVMTFDKDFLIGKPTIDYRYVDQLRQVKLHAVTDGGSTLHSEYPASPTYVYGNTTEQSYIRCNNQATLDNWCERKYLFENRDYTVTWTAPGCVGLLFELLDRVQITYAGTSANGVHVNWSEKKFWIHNIVVNPTAGNTGTTQFTLEAENV